MSINADTVNQEVVCKSDCVVRIHVYPLHKLQPLEFEQVRRSAQEPLFNSLLEEHHYLGYEQPVGEGLKFLVWAQPPQRRGPVAGNPGERRPIACVAWSSAPRHLGSRDRYIGWDAAARRNQIRFIAYNTRFLILPWVRVEHLASHLLGRMAARIWPPLALLRLLLLLKFMFLFLFSAVTG